MLDYLALMRCVHRGDCTGKQVQQRMAHDAQIMLQRSVNAAQTAPGHEAVTRVPRWR